MLVNPEEQYLVAYLLAVPRSRYYSHNVLTNNQTIFLQKSYRSEPHHYQHDYPSAFEQVDVFFSYSC